MSSRCSPLPGCGMDAGPGTWFGLVTWVAAPERAAAHPYLRTSHTWWLHAQVSRDAPPPLPGGYKVGDKVFYTAANHNFADGDKLRHGQQGEVTGPPTLANVKGKGVKVLFTGNKGNVDCDLSHVCRRHAASAAIPPGYAPHATLHACARPARAVLPQPDPNCKPLQQQRWRGATPNLTPQLFVIARR